MVNQSITSKRIAIARNRTVDTFGRMCYTTDVVIETSPKSQIARIQSGQTGGPMAAPRKPLDQMSKAEQEKAFNEWYLKQNERRILSRAKRSAATTLRNLHQSEYDKFLAQAKVDILAKLASGQMSDADLDQDDESEPVEPTVTEPEVVGPTVPALPSNTNRQGRNR